MKKSIIAIAVIAVAVIAWLLFFPNEKKIVLKQLDKIIDSVIKPAGEGNIAAATKNLAFGALLDETNEISITIDEFPYNGSHSSSELASLEAQGRLYCETIDIRLKGADVEIKDGVATINFTAAFTVVTKFGAKYDEIRPFVATLKKIEKKWKFTAFRDKQVLKK
ncbi:MAG: hypothetical protein IKZ46_04645 [Victivallales bacterium]|nr:hypothetical protein [Victivallales bacterium]